VNVSGLTSGVTAISAGYKYTCAIVANGVKCWGDNTRGQLGDGTASFAPVNTLFSALTTYSYDANHKHAVISLSSGDSYQYDANGNMTQRIEGETTYTQVFDAENRLVSVIADDQTTQFIYNGDGNMVKKINPDGSSTTYIGSVYEVDKDAEDTITGTIPYYPAAGSMRADGTLYYVLGDQLGSASAVLDENGDTVGETRYQPFGETRSSTGSMFTDRMYTGQREVAILGLYFYNARFYDAGLGRFISPDSIIAGARNPQALNRYAYALNSPMNVIDPSGHYGLCPGTITQNDDGYCGYADYIAKVTPTIPTNPAEPQTPSDPINMYDLVSGIRDETLTIPTDLTWSDNYSNGSSTDSNNCPLGWISAATTSNGSCGHAEINGNAIVDPIAWEHIVGATLVGIVTIGIGGLVMIPLAVDLCTTVAGCVAGVMLGAGGVGAVIGGGVMVWSGVKFTQEYLGDIFVVKP
jgi:RHS repeat-associated protein